MKTFQIRLIEGLTVLSLLLVACAKQRDIRPVLPNGRRIQKTLLAGTFIYLKSIKHSDYPGPLHGRQVATGIYEQSDQLVQFILRENTLDIVSIDPLYTEERSIELNRKLASFNVRHVDVLRTKNENDEDTHIEEETQTRRVWQERDYVVVDLASDIQDEWSAERTKSSSSGDRIEIDPATGVINFEVLKQLKDDTLITQSYSFMPFKPSASYLQKEYPRLLQDRFGLFKTLTYQLDKYGRATTDLRKQYINRWDASKKIVYFLSKDYPSHLIPSTQAVFSAWNSALKQATGIDLLELRENSGQALGDLRYNMVYFDTSTSGNFLLGYGPSVTNPRTGEIVKADVILYGNTLRRALFSQGLYEKILGDSDPLSQLALGRSMNISILDRKITQTQFKSRLLAGGLSNLDPAILSEFKTKRTQLKIDSSMEMGNPETCLAGSVDEIMIRLAQESAQEGPKVFSDEELEIRIFMPLLAHELGHNLGLRHNFMASADRENFAPGLRASSVMDYGYIASHEPQGPGPYDVATLQYAYGSSEIQSLLFRQFYYCTDEHIRDPRLGLCNQFDAGTNLADSIRNMFNRYQASYLLNNIKFGRVHFPLPRSEYISRVWSALVPIRLALDHASAVERIIQDYQLSTDTGTQKMALIRLWSLVRRRIEVAEHSPTKLPYFLGELEGTKVIVDLEKIVPLLKDARSAKNIAFAALRWIVLEPQRPDFDSTDFIHQEVQRMGVLTDRMLALDLLSRQSFDPLGEGGIVSPFGEVREAVADLFAMLLSNTYLTTSGPTQVEYNRSLREVAFELIKSEMALVGTVSAQTKELLRLIPASRVDQPNLETVHKARELIRTALLILAKPNATEEEKLKAEKQLEEGIQMRNSVNDAFIELGGQILKAPLVHERLALNTGTGLFIKDNINFIEDVYLFTVIADIKETLDQLKIETDPIKKEQLTQRSLRLTSERKNIEDYLFSEQLFIEQYYRFYKPN